MNYPVLINVASVSVYSNIVRCEFLSRTPHSERATKPQLCAFLLSNTKLMDTSVNSVGRCSDKGGLHTHA